MGRRHKRMRVAFLFPHLFLIFQTAFAPVARRTHKIILSMTKPPSNAGEVLGARLRAIMEMEEALVYNKACCGCGREVESYGVAVRPFAIWEHTKAPKSARMPEKIYCDACNVKFQGAIIRLGYQMTKYKKQIL